MKKIDIGDNQGRESEASRESTRRILVGPIGAAFLAFLVLVLGMVAFRTDLSGFVGVVVWVAVVTLACLAVVLIARAAS